MKAPVLLKDWVNKDGSRTVSYKKLDMCLDGIFDVLRKVLDKERDRVKALEAEIATLKSAPLLKDAGTWKHGGVYALGDVAQFSGSPWVCTRAHTASGPTADHSCWRLWVKSGRDGRDAR